MIVKLLTEQHLELLSLKGGCTGSSESTLVKMPHCWKSHVAAHLFFLFGLNSLKLQLLYSLYSKTCLKRPLKNRQNKGLKDKW